MLANDMVPASGSGWRRAHGLMSYATKGCSRFVTPPESLLRSMCAVAPVCERNSLIVGDAASSAEVATIIRARREALLPLHPHPHGYRSSFQKTTVLTLKLASCLGREA